MNKFFSEKEYELVIVFDTTCESSSVLEPQLDLLKKSIESEGGEILKQDIWGKRQLAYQINNNKYGFYIVTVFKGSNALVSTIERSLRINERVLRFLTVRKDKYAPDFTPALKNDSYDARVSENDDEDKLDNRL